MKRRSARNGPKPSIESNEESLNVKAESEIPSPISSKSSRSFKIPRKSKSNTVDNTPEGDAFVSKRAIREIKSSVSVNESKGDPIYLSIVSSTPNAAETDSYGMSAMSEEKRAQSKRKRQSSTKYGKEFLTNMSESDSLDESSTLAQIMENGKRQRKGRKSLIESVNSSLNETKMKDGGASHVTQSSAGSKTNSTIKAESNILVLANDDTDRNGDLLSLEPAKSGGKKPAGTASRRKGKPQKIESANISMSSDKSTESCHDKSTAFSENLDVEITMNEEQKTPVTKSANQRNRKSTIQKQCEVNEEFEKEIKCFHCEYSDKNYSSLRYHYASAHMRLYTTDNPEGLNDADSLGQILKIAGKLVCLKCDKVIKFLHYYKQHMTWCGTGDENTLVECDLCGSQRIKSQWLHQHKLYCQKKMAEREAKKVSQNKEVKQDRKRAAATKALNTIKSFNNDQPNEETEKEAEKEQSDTDEAVISEGSEDSDDAAEAMDGDEVSETKSKRKKKDSKEMVYDSFHCYTKYDEKTICAGSHISHSPRLPMIPLQNITKMPRPESLNTSVKFTIGKQAAYNQLDEGEFVTHSQSVIVSYAGSPITHLKWCPVDSFNEQTTLKGSQYAACCHYNKTNTDDLYKAKGLITVWKFNLEVDSLSSHHVLSIAHDFGSVNCMQWCPEDGFMKLETGLSRLGLLALCTSDGFVHVISVPLIIYPTDNHIYEISVDKDLRLEVFGNSAQCTCMDWQRGDNKFIAAGFNDGSVAIWFMENNTTAGSLQPIKVIRPYRSLITCINWCKFNPSLFSVLSHGWCIWDVNDMNTARFTPPKLADSFADLNVKSAWPRLYPYLAICTDPSFGTPSFNLHMFGYDRLNGCERTPLRDLQYTTDVDICDCSNTICASDTSGYVTYNACFLKYRKSANKHFIHKTALKTVSAGNTDSVIKFNYNTSQKVNMAHYKGNLCDPATIIKDNRDDAINSISLNPNTKGHGWLICGGTHGLLHLINLAKN